MRVLHVISAIDPAYGGPAVALSGLCKAQRRAGLDVSVVASFQSGTTTTAADDLRDDGVAVHLIGPARGPLSRHPELAATVERLVAQADVVHIHALWEEIQHRAARSAQRRGVPYIVRPCGMLDPWSLRQSRWKKKLYLMWRLRRNLDRAAALHFTSEMERELTAPLKLKAPAIVEPNGVELAEFADLPPRGTFRAQHAIGERPMVLFLSRLHPKKGLELLVPAVAQVGPRDAVLCIAGPDSDGYAETIRQLAAQSGIGDRTIFTGMLRGRQRVEALADADLFVLPSHQENFGIAVVEALAAGTPVVISDQVNIHREITAAGVGGVVSMRVDALASEISRWLSDAPLRATAAAKARPFVWEHYDWNQIARRWVEHYQKQTTSSARHVKPV